jgi:hypothetical protein
MFLRIASFFNKTLSISRKSLAFFQKKAQLFRQF